MKKGLKVKEVNSIELRNILMAWHIDFEAHNRDIITYNIAWGWLDSPIEELYDYVKSKAPEGELIKLLTKYRRLK